MATTTTSIKLDDETRDRVKRLADARKRSAHWVMREAIEQYVGREEQRQQSWDAADAAWTAFQQDGHHVSGTEADEWLEKLEVGEEAATPKWHR